MNLYGGNGDGYRASIIWKRLKFFFACFLNYILECKEILGSWTTLLKWQLDPKLQYLIQSWIWILPNLPWRMHYPLWKLRVNSNKTSQTLQNCQTLLLIIEQHLREGLEFFQRLKNFSMHIADINNISSLEKVANSFCLTSWLFYSLHLTTLLIVNDRLRLYAKAFHSKLFNEISSIFSLSLTEIQTDNGSTFHIIYPAAA